ncbi:MAG: hypothetical protein ACRDOJ_07980, partial [Nocardioidaceae bacterium]
VGGAGSATPRPGAIEVYLGRSRRKGGFGMKVRADQVRTGQRIRGATVMRVRPALDRGMVRITLKNTGVIPRQRVPDGTFCYLADDIVEVDLGARTPVHG